MRYLSTFSGVGGFERGIQLAYESLDNRPTRKKEQEVDTEQNSPDASSKYTRQSPTCIGYSEIDKYASAIYQKHFPNHTNYGDITKIVAEELPDFDLLVGGFPCQAFSIAGKRGGFEDTRGTMFFELARILRAKQPRLCVFENVKGLLSHDGGKSFATIIQTLDELGYDSQWQVLNSKNHGVPQNRERVFIIGHLRGTPRPEVFPFGESDRKSNDQSIQKSNGSSPRPLFRVADSEITRREIQSGYQIRRLTPVECERLQGFPDGWTEGVSDTQRYKCLGNAVTVNVIRDIFEKIL
jgi:DNA-cytosine methyltransferase